MSKERKTNLELRSTTDIDIKTRELLFSFTVIYRQTI